jgi:hypothetical protein
VLHEDLELLEGAVNGGAEGDVLQSALARLGRRVEIIAAMYRHASKRALTIPTTPAAEPSDRAPGVQQEAPVDGSQIHSLLLGDLKDLRLTLDDMFFESRHRLDPAEAEAGAEMQERYVDALEYIRSIGEYADMLEKALNGKRAA